MVEKNNRSFNLNNSISEKELKMINIVMDKYRLKTIKVEKVRSSYKVQTEKGVICLKKMRHGRKKVKNGSILVEELSKQNFNDTTKYIKTKDGLIFVKYKKLIFYVTDWIEGEECKFSDINEAINCVKVLARFHISTKTINLEKIKIPNNLKNWSTIFKSNLNDLDKFKKAISNKRLKNNFDVIYMEHIENFYSRGLAAINVINTSQYNKLSKKAAENKTICHNSFYYQNIIKKENNYYLIDLDSIIIDLQINDLGKFIRRLMYKKNYKWDFCCAKSLIEAYSFVNKLTKEELEIMLALIIFPHKFWSLGKKRYKKHKNWTEVKYMHKLNKIIDYDEYQNKFYEDYVNYLKTY